MENITVYHIFADGVDLWEEKKENAVKEYNNLILDGYCNVRLYEELQDIDGNTISEDYIDGIGEFPYKLNTKIKGHDMKIYELKYKSGRLFRVSVDNNCQEKRLNAIIQNNWNNAEDKIIAIEIIVNGINTLKQFELISKTIK